ncbi:CHASE2 domain-containing protein [Leptolyngbya sp. BC1307]|uniref:CHASE2 domain-containing protein n=1 Tax=Leptolyngbya sp. BC1307 TaxID=2029589 RepID=UPI000EFD1FF5|nr:CHASE2 domain-containing protein [Leptolyngbya sp. BC1307]
MPIASQLGSQLGRQLGRQLVSRFRWLHRIVPGLMVSLLVVMLLQLNAWVPMERIATSALMRWRGSVGWDSRVVMISVDDKTLSQLGQFPISRDYYANLLQLLTQSDTSAVVFNLLLADIQSAGADTAESAAVDARLAQAMTDHGRVVIGQTWGLSGIAIEPLPILESAAIATGHLRVQIDPDGLTRRIELLVEDIPALGIAAVQVYSLEKELVSIPTALSEIQINWPGPISELTTLSLINVLNGQFSPSSLKDKIIVVGYGATSGRTHLRTPFDSRAPVPGGYLQAAVIDNLLGQRWLRSPSKNTVALALLIGGSLLGGLFYRREVGLQLMAGSAIALSWLLLCVVALRCSYLLPVATPLIAVGAVTIGAIILGRLQASALLQVRSAFLSTVSHEIRTPLNAIINLSEMLQETPLDHRQREFAETLYNSSQTLMVLINDILDFSKIESGRLLIEKYPVCLNETLERSLEMLAPRATRKGLELVHSIAPTTPAVILSDPVRLQQILLNLLSNAVKFTEAGEVSVRVEAIALIPPTPLFSHQRSTLKHWAYHWKNRRTSQQPTAPPPAPSRYEICFAISDTGIGIAPERMAQLFEPFCQGSVSTARKYGGTGLGLSISKRLSEYLGGNLWVKSSLGEGSTFYFTVQAELAANRQPMPSYLTGLSGTHLLLIDPNPTRRNYLDWQLQPLGISITPADSLSAALRLMRNTAFDGIILDEAVAVPAHQPSLYGPIASADSLTQRLATLHAAAGCNQLPIILLSALRSTASPPAEVTATLWKPIKQAALYQSLRFICPTDLPIPPPAAVGLVASEGDRRACLTILIAEDNRINQRVALRLLELLGYQADVACSGKAVLAALQRQRYDVILMDMRMPDTDGTTATRQIRQMDQHQNTWIIAMTASTTRQDRQRCFDAGMNDYLTKPIKREVLAQALQRCPAMQQKI